MPPGHLASSSALENVGYSSELIAYSDDMDALRKVPAGLPDWLEKEIGKPVSEIRDPFDCHDSYGTHMSALLLDGLDKMGMKYKFQSGYKAYKSGTLVKQIEPHPEQRRKDRSDDRRAHWSEEVSRISSIFPTVREMRTAKRCQTLQI